MSKVSLSLSLALVAFVALATPVQANLHPVAFNPPLNVVYTPPPKPVPVVVCMHPIRKKVQNFTFTTCGD